MQGKRFPGICHSQIHVRFDVVPPRFMGVVPACFYHRSIQGDALYSMQREAILADDRQSGVEKRKCIHISREPQAAAEEMQSLNPDTWAEKFRKFWTDNLYMWNKWKFSLV